MKIEKILTPPTTPPSQLFSSTNCQFVVVEALRDHITLASPTWRIHCLFIAIGLDIITAIGLVMTIAKS